MAIRGDVVIDWEVSPRIITVQAPSTAISMQDLLDTLRRLEAQPSAMDDPYIVDASGKENLGGGTKVGITVQLQNAKIGFSDRPGPEWVLCTLDGGNLVAVDVNGNDMDARHPTAYVTIDRTSSASATLQEQDALQYSSYGGVVSVDVTSSISGTDYPAGNMEFPVNNIQDAVSIGDDKGFDTLFIRGDITLGSGDNVAGFTLVGQNITRSYLTVLDAAETINCEFRNFTITGVLDGGSTVRECEIHTLNYVNGYVSSCVLTENIITLGGNNSALFLDCWSGVPGSDTPTIDMGGSGQELAVRGYEGGLKIKNKTGTDAASLDFSSGQFIADSTVTNGTIIVRGDVGKITDNSTGTAVVDTSGVTSGGLTTEEHDILVQTGYQRKQIFVNTGADTNGDGTALSPFDNINDAKDKAELLGVKELIVIGEITIPRRLKNFTVIGIGLTVVECNGQDLSGTEFIHCEMRGNHTGSVIVRESRLATGYTMNGNYKDVALGGDINVASGGHTILKDGASGIGGVGRPKLTFTGGGVNFSLRNFSGGLDVDGITDVNDSVTLSFAQGKLGLLSGCTGGFVSVRGNCLFEDSSNGTTVDNTALVSTLSADAVWGYVI